MTHANPTHHYVLGGQHRIEPIESRNRSCLPLPREDWIGPDSSLPRVDPSSPPPPLNLQALPLPHSLRWSRISIPVFFDDPDPPPQPPTIVELEALEDRLSSYLSRRFGGGEPGYFPPTSTLDSQESPVMTKAQLIALLANFPDDTPVYLVAYTDAPGGEYLEPPHPRLAHAYTNVHRQTVPDWTNSKKDLKSHHSVIIL